MPFGAMDSYQRRQEQTERTFHVVMGAVLLGSLFLDQMGGGWWNPPRVSMITLVVGMVWVGRYAWSVKTGWQDREKVLMDRIERMEQKMAGVEDEVRRRAGSGLHIEPK